MKGTVGARLDRITREDIQFTFEVTRNRSALKASGVLRIPFGRIMKLNEISKSGDWG